jgi:hypothetical protein
MNEPGFTDDVRHGDRPERPRVGRIGAEVAQDVDASIGEDHVALVATTGIAAAGVPHVVLVQGDAVEKDHPVVERNALAWEPDDPLYIRLVRFISAGRTKENEVTAARL